MELASCHHSGAQNFEVALFFKTMAQQPQVGQGLLIVEEL
jgi:hypothetical protein